MRRRPEMTIHHPAAPPSPRCAPPLRAPRRRPSSLSMSDTVAGQIAVGAERPEREVRGITVISQVEHPRKSGSRETRIVPQPIRLLRAHQKLGAAPHTLGGGPPRREQSQKSPRSLVRGAWESYGLCMRQRIGIVALAPAAVGILLELQPIDGAPNGGIVGTDVRLYECRQHRPGAVNIVGAPAAEPRTIGFLLFAQVDNREV